MVVSIINSILQVVGEEAEQDRENTLSKAISELEAEYESGIS